MRAPERARTSGIRNPSPISTSSPRETTTSRPSASAATARRTAAALLLTTSAASAPVSRPSASATWSCRDPREPDSRSSSRFEYEPPTSVDPRESRRRERRAAEVRVDDHAGRVEHAPQRGRLEPLELRPRGRRDVTRIAAGGDRRRALPRARPSRPRARAHAARRPGASSASSRSTDGRSRRSTDLSLGAGRTSRRSATRSPAARGTDLENALVVDRLRPHAGGGVRHAGEREAPDPHVAGREHLRAPSTSRRGRRRAPASSGSRRASRRPARARPRRRPRRARGRSASRPRARASGRRGRRRRSCRGSAARATRRSARRAATSPEGSGGRRSRRGAPARREASIAPQAFVSTRLRTPSRPSTRTPKTTVAGGCPS